MLNISNDNNKAVLDPLTLHLLQAAKAVIPGKRKDPQPPTLKEWAAKVEEIRKLEELTHILHNNSSKYWNIWSSWINHINTQGKSKKPTH
ncbi:hypothetical protein XELAEV_18003997mg [Xenopus laevis]|uniref:Uncharacterized protein n=1 Tax=Xenopus laevis TaxID=8355 RepID=A0A974BRZ3_XENLA|nr:hypothetical protein XELAEV_18003997mg [Xenopus laevis]